MSTPLISETAFWANCAHELSQSLQNLALREAMPRFKQARIAIKADGSLLSDADLAIQGALPDLLNSFYPAPLLGEEMSEKDQKRLWETHLSGSSTFWIADPIDGTTNFVHGNPWFAVSVALIHKGSTVLGVTVAPGLNNIWHAALGSGSYCNGIRLSLSTEPRDFKDCVMGIDMTYLPACLRHRVADISPAGIARGEGQTAPWRGWRSLGASTLEWCALASGQIHAYVHGGQMPWDAAAGKIILAEAGGFSAPLDHILYKHAVSTPSLTPTAYAAAAPSIWPLWQHWLQQHLQQPACE